MSFEFLSLNTAGGKIGLLLIITINGRAFKYHIGLLKVITCNLRGSSYRRNLGVIIFNGRSI